MARARFLHARSNSTGNPALNTSRRDTVNRSLSSRAPPTILGAETEEPLPENDYVIDDNAVGATFHGGIAIYKAKLNNTDPVFMAVVHRSDLNAYNRLKVEVNKSSLLRRTDDNILQVLESFEEGGLYYVAVENVYDSLRSLIKAKTENNGVSSDYCIQVVLREVLRGLMFLHDQGINHGNLHLGNVYFTAGKGSPDAAIKVGFGASMLEMNSTKRNGPAASWYLAHDYWMDQKSDIWMVGLIGLELAYGGGLGFKKDKDFYAFLKCIKKTRMLPTRHVLKEYQRGSWGVLKNFLKSEFRHDIDPKVSEIIVLCFETEKLLTPHQLLQHEGLRNCTFSPTNVLSCLDAHANHLQRQKQRFPVPPSNA